jgi:hypothetical protein
LALDDAADFAGAQLARLVFFFIDSGMQSEVGTGLARRIDVIAQCAAAAV